MRHLSDTSSPKVSVVMPVYNAAAYLDQAVTSILDQTFRDFEFIIVNDGSTDVTTSILDQYETSDTRIRVYHQEHQGMIAALNRGCRLARGTYIARMDADDVSFPHRLQTQLEYIEKHAEIGILGTWICIIENGSVRRHWCPPTNAKMLKWTHFFGACVPHPTVLIRRKVLQRLNFYGSNATHAEDVDLWLRASRLTEFGNIPEVLYRYRVWPGSISQADLQIRRKAHADLLVAFIRDFLKIDPTDEAVVGLRRTRVGPPFENLRDIQHTTALIYKLYKTFVKENALTSKERREISWDAAKRIASLALQASRFSRAASVAIGMQALKLNYRLLCPSAVMKGVRRAFNRSPLSTQRSQQRQHRQCRRGHFRANASNEFDRTPQTANDLK